MRKPIASLFQDTRYEQKDSPGSYPISVQFYFDRKRSFVFTGVNLSIEDFELITKGKPRTFELKGIKSDLENQITKANRVLEDLGINFSHERAKRFFQDNSYQTDKNSIYVGFDSYIQELEQNGQIKSSDSYNSAKNSLKSFSPVLSYSKVTTEFLESYEDWLVNEKGKSNTTLAIYLRNLRTILNKGIKKELLSNKAYPFGKGKYIIPTGRNVKKALTIEDIRAIQNYFTVPNSPSDKAKDFFLFSYLSNGINFKDIAKLKNDSIKSGQIHFIRAKTQRTKRDFTPIKTSLRAETLAIIEKWRGDDRSPKAYLFPILKPQLTPKQETRRIQDFTKKTNQCLKPIGEKLELPLKLTTYVARHSFATIAINIAGAPMEYVSEALGHTSLNTTRNYIDSFEDKRIKEITDLLL
jgi:integrase/recombinase XerD